MATRHRAELKAIRTFPSLVAYLRDEMGWPIASDDFEELTFDYTPEELGIDPTSAAKIQEIKRLRPLTTKQPWGIFFVKFEPKHLPVVALRRILSRVVLRKRASANSSERAAWAVDDLLFVSNFGQGEQRQISFAHFSHEGKRSDIPTLRVLGWDSSDTPLKLDDVAEKLTENLAWPADEADVATWQATWRSAFTLRHGEVITTSKALAVRLAELARSIRDRIKTVLEIETDDGSITKLMTAFRAALVHDLDANDFADMYAQTIAYGLLSARIENRGSGTADDFAAHMRTSPFLKELMDSFLRVGAGRPNGAADATLDFDELGVSDVVEVLDRANMEAVVRDFGDANPLEDPVIHFYELFLKEYDAKQRMHRGVFYTPRAIVSYIVRSIDALLQTDLGLEDGMADTVTWGEMAERRPGLRIPERVDPGHAFVQILDPATGTGTFLVEVIDLVHRRMTEKWASQGADQETIDAKWNEYVPGHLLPRLHGYELLMAPYAIAHLKLALKLIETGYRFESDERARVYLTNTLEPPQNIEQGTLGHAFPALAHEAQAVNEVKSGQRFTVIVGNPPYSSAAGAPSSAFVRSLMKPFTEGLGVETERKKGALQDDYVRFVAFSRDMMARSGAGALGLITNNSYIDGTLHRSMRKVLLESFSPVEIVNLHGSSRAGSGDSSDQNVFEIMQGVAILTGVVTGTRAQSRDPDESHVSYSELIGPRSMKYEALANDGLVRSTLAPTPPYYLLRPIDAGLFSEYEAFISVESAFETFSSGIETEKDHFAVALAPTDLKERLQAFCDLSMPADEIASRYGLKSTPNWDLEESRAKLAEQGLRDDLLIRYVYHCFDHRYTYYSDAVITRSRRPVMRHMDLDNLALVCLRQVKGEAWAHAFVAAEITNKFTLSSKSSNVSYHLPLYLQVSPQGEQPALVPEERIDSNIRPGVLAAVAGGMGLTANDAGDLEFARRVLFYIYATFYSPAFRSRYGEYLTLGFPRFPLPSSSRLFDELANLGEELVAAHLLRLGSQESLSANFDEDAEVWHYETQPGEQLPIGVSFDGPREPVVTKVGWSNDTVWLDATKSTRASDRAETVVGSIGFHGIPEDVWKLRVGGYQVCEKWLKDRGPKRGKPGRTLTAEDLAHYHRVVIALHKTIRIAQAIDGVIEKHGGWPGAFKSEVPGH